MRHPTVRFLPIGGGEAEEDSGLCERNLNLLAHAQAIELGIGSRCGGHGICGGDRVRIEPGEGGTPLLSPVSEAEREHLSKDEIAQGWRLACQCYPEKSDQLIRVSYRPES